MALLTLGRVLGWFIVTGFVLAVLYPMLKYLNQNKINKLPKDLPARKHFQRFFRTYIKVHPYVGMATAAIMLLHFAIQFSLYGFYLSGFIAGSLLLQTGLGVYGFYFKKRKPGTWLTIHRWLPLLMVVMVTVHIFSVYR